MPNKKQFDRDSIIDFGKHKGKTVQDLLDDPRNVGYLKCMAENVDRIQLSEDVLAELETKKDDAPF